MDGFEHVSEISHFSLEEFYHLCFKVSTDIIYLVDTDMKIMNVSPSIRNVLGYSMDECIGTTFYELNKISLNNLPQVLDDQETLARGSKVEKREYLCHTNNGREVVLEVNGAPLYQGNRVNGAILAARDITSRKRYEADLTEILGNLRKSLDVTIKTISRTVDIKDPYTAGHQQRVSDLARAIATEMGMDNDSIDGIRMAGIIHDIGKITIPSEILSKPGRLHLAEMELIKIHPIIGFDILSSIDFPWPVAAMVLQHHERENGSGYPYCIPGEYIIKEAKIIGVADVVEALATHRPYRASVGIEEALKEVQKNAGILYDAEIVEACVRLFMDKGYQFPKDISGIYNVD